MAYIRGVISHVFKTYPLVSNSLIYGGLYMTAEFSQQTIIKKVLVSPLTRGGNTDYVAGHLVFLIY